MLGWVTVGIVVAGIRVEQQTEGMRQRVADGLPEEANGTEEEGGDHEGKLRRVGVDAIAFHAVGIDRVAVV